MYKNDFLIKAGAVLLSLCLFAGCGAKASEAVTPTQTPEPVKSEFPSGFRVGSQVSEAYVDNTKKEEETVYMEREDKISEKPFLKADGKNLRDDSGKGELVQLKGTNVGGWFLQEFWMTVTAYSDNVTAENDVIRELTERFGEEEADRLMEIYRENFFTEADLDYCKSLGMNCLRLPIWYRTLTDENGNLYENAFDRIDWFVEEAGKRGIYVILDMHGAPGSQNGSDHSGIDGHDEKMINSKFFFGTEEEVSENQRLFYEIWEKIAAHYNGNPWVGGYDLLNEPFCTFRYNTGLKDSVLLEMLWDIYDEAYRRIRAIDPDHLIIMEATWNPSDLPHPDRYGWENVMYEYHNYLYDDYNNAKGQQIANMRKKMNDIKKADYNVPSYLGEFAYFDNIKAWDDGVKLINDTGMSWTTWTYKTISSVGNWGIRHTRDAGLNLEKADAEKIEAAWSKVSEETENTLLSKTLSKYFKMVFIEAK